MTERSRFWDGTTTGDATEAAYDAATEFARVLRALMFGSEQTADKGGVVNGAVGFGDLAATLPGGGICRIASGLAFVQGNWYESDANVDFSIPTPATSTRVDRIVLRKSWAGQTVRLTRIAGTEGAGVPAMTQTFGTTWDIPIVNASITTGGVITLTDTRALLLVHTHSGGGGGGAISHASLSGVTTDQHHAIAHVHLADGSGTVAHTSLSSIGTNTHAQIDTALANAATHAASNLVAIAHGVQRINTTGTVSLGTPTNGILTFARANGGALTLTTPSGVIVISTTSASSLALVNGESVVLVADGTNWTVF